MVRVCCLAVLLTGCFFDPAGLKPVASDSLPLEDSASPEQQFPADQRVDERATDLSPRVDSRTDAPEPCAALPCDLGCNAAARRCNRLKPATIDESTLNALFAAKGLGNVELGEINTSTGTIKDSKGTELRTGTASGGVTNGLYWSTQTQSGAPELAIVGVNTLTLQAGKTLTVRGTRALVLYALGDVTINGSLVLPPAGKTPGAGGFAGGDKGQAGVACAGGQGQAGKTDSGNHQSGGGGGGFGGSGGPGGASTTIAGGTGGTAVTAQMSYLRGGCGGGGGGTGSGNQDDGRPGGGGGGALQISANGTLTVAGTISVPGAGGTGSPHAGGGGGGAGGMLVLEAAKIAGSGMLAANGGGGGAGGNGGAVGKDGASGTTTSTPASGGDKNGNSGGAGGAGTTRNGSSGSAAGNGGGGGGAVGRIYLRARSMSNELATKASPSPSQGPPAVF